MLCQNCGDKEANVSYTQIINGIKKEMALCDTCAKKLGLQSLDFNMPIHFSNFLGDFLEEYEDSSFLPSFVKQAHPKCDICQMEYERFLKNGMFGCPECYEVFSDRIEPILKNLHGNTRHIGRIPKRIEKKSKVEEPKEVKTEKFVNKSKTEIEILKEELKQAIKEENYEQAAVLRDKIKKLEN